MIRLEVEDYCQSCLDFHPDVIGPEKIWTGYDEYVLTDTVVKCEYRKRCNAIKKYLEQQAKTEASG
jgi:hypothetical protein